MSRKSDTYRLVTEYGLSPYPCGLCRGEEVRIKKPIVVRDSSGKKTGKVYPNGEVWTVLSGVKDEPDVIWLRQADGERHTWDSSSFFETFERVNPKEPIQPPQTTTGSSAPDRV